jgi:hypothetical protein
MKILPIFILLLFVSAIEIFAAATRLPSRLWPDNPIAYRIDIADATIKNNISAMLKLIEDKTALSFEPIADPRSLDGKRPWMQFVQSAGSTKCSAAVGFQGNISHPIRLGSACGQRSGTVLHEILHTLGFIHEHQRSDSEGYVSVKWDMLRNENEEIKRQYKIFYNPPHRPVIQEHTRYDFSSIMHYPLIYLQLKPASFSDPTYKYGSVGQRNDLSPLDLETLVKIYGR